MENKKEEVSQYDMINNSYEFYRETIRALRKRLRVLNISLSVALIIIGVLIGFCINKTNQYNKYREDSISKRELIEVIENLNRIDAYE